MSSNNAANSGQTPLYKIGAVSRLTGLPSNTIRTWERRYQVVQPERTPSGGRVYSDKDVVRLQLIAVLLDLDESISSISGLSEDELRQRIQRHQSLTGNTATPSEPTSQLSRIAIISKDHQVLSDMLSAPGGTHFTVSHASATPDSFVQGSANILVVDIDALDGDPVYEVKTITKHSGVDATIVLYSFCRSLTLVSLSEQGVRLVRKPINPSILRRVIEDHARVTRILRHSRRARKTFDELPKDGEQTNLVASRRSNLLGWPILPPRQIVNAPITWPHCSSTSLHSKIIRPAASQRGRGCGTTSLSSQSDSQGAEFHGNGADLSAGA